MCFVCLFNSVSPRVFMLVCLIASLMHLIYTVLMFFASDYCMLNTDCFSGCVCVCVCMCEI